VLNQNIDCPHGYTYVKDHDVTLHDYINRTCGTQVPLFMAKTWSVIAGICTGTCISIIVLIVLGKCTSVACKFYFITWFY
jgi:hypothetical protein